MIRLGHIQSGNDKAVMRRVAAAGIEYPVEAAIQQRDVGLVAHDSGAEEIIWIVRHQGGVAHARGVAVTVQQARDGNGCNIGIVDPEGIVPSRPCVCCRCLLIVVSDERLAVHRISRGSGITEFDVDGLARPDAASQSKHGGHREHAWSEQSPGIEDLIQDRVVHGVLFFMGG